MTISLGQYYKNEGFADFKDESIQYYIPVKPCALSEAIDYFDQNAFSGDIYAISSWSIGGAYNIYGKHLQENQKNYISQLNFHLDTTHKPQKKFKAVFLECSYPLLHDDYIYKLTKKKHPYLIFDLNKKDITRLRFKRLWLIVSSWNNLERNTKNVIKWCDENLHLERVKDFCRLQIRIYSKK